MEKLIAEHLLTHTEIKDMESRFYQRLEEAYLNSKKETFNPNEWIAKLHEPLMEVKQFGKASETGVPVGILREFG